MRVALKSWRLRKNCEIEQARSPKSRNVRGFLFLVVSLVIWRIVTISEGTAEVGMDTDKKTLSHPSQRRCTIVLGLHLPEFCTSEIGRSLDVTHISTILNLYVCLFWQFQTVCINSAELPIETASPVGISGVEFCRLVHLKIFEIYPIYPC